MKRNAFKKPEHLCHRNDIEALFTAGSHACTAYPLRAVYRYIDRKKESQPTVYAMMSVAKRRLRHAIARNRAKRQMREAYRMNKSILYEAIPNDLSLQVCFIWLVSGSITSSTVAEKMLLLLQRIAENRPAQKVNGKTTVSPSHSSNNQS